MVAPTAFQEERVDGHGTPQEVLTIMSIQSMTTPDSLPHWDGFQEDYLSRIHERFHKLPQFLENPLSATAAHYVPDFFAASSDSSALKLFSNTWASLPGCPRDQHRPERPIARTATPLHQVQHGGSFASNSKLSESIKPMDEKPSAGSLSWPLSQRPSQHRRTLGPARPSSTAGSHQWMQSIVCRSVGERLRHRDAQCAWH